jgi:hypothetical protein
MKRVVVFIGIILVAGGGLFAKKHRAETIKNYLPPVTLVDPAAAPLLVKDGIFSDKVDLWGDPWVKTGEVRPDPANVAFQTDPKPANVEKFQSKSDYHAEPVLTVQDRQVAYSLFEVGGFTMTLNLKPAYANPQALVPAHIDAGIGGSFSF